MRVLKLSVCALLALALIAPVALAEGSKLPEEGSFHVDVRALTLFDYGMALLGLEQNREALSVFEEVLKRRPAWGVAYANLGLSYERLGEFNQAASAYSQALACDSSLVEIRASLALVYAQIGRREEAATCAQSYLASRPEGERAERLKRQLIEAGLVQP